MTDLERYLQLATWSLWGAQKRTVRLELESHIAHKTWKYQTRGFSETQALQKALVDLGAPHVISAGMTGVYTMPTLFRNTVLVGLLLSLGITTFQSSAQVAGTNRLPIEPCLKSTNSTFKVGTDPYSCKDSYGFFLSLEQLKADLEPKGVKFDNTKSNGLFLTFPQGKPLYVSQGGGSIGIGKTEFDYSKEFVRAAYFLTQDLPKSGLPITLSGWEKPVVSVGETQFDISFPQSESQPEFLYGSLVFDSISRIFNKIGTSYSITPDDEIASPYFPFQVMDEKYRNRIQFNADPDRVYVFVKVGKDKRLSVSSRVLHLDRNTFNATGQQKKLKFVDSWDKLIPMKLDAINPQRSGTVILARVNTSLNDQKQILEIINPNEIRVLGNAERLVAKDTTQSSFCQDKGGANTSMTGRWSGDFQSVNNQGQNIVGRLNSKVQPNGVYEGEIVQSSPIKAKGISLGAFCKNNQFVGSYAMKLQDTIVEIPLNTGSIKQISANLIEGSSIERDETNKIISRTYFRLRKQ